MPDDLQTASGKNLSAWVKKQQALRREGKLPPEQMNLLTAIGMEWEFKAAWEVGFAHAERYSRENGNLDVEGSYVCEDGYSLGRWLANQRANHNHPTRYHTLTTDQSKRLETIGIVWKPHEAQWTEGYRHAAAYLKLLNGMLRKTNYVSPDGYKTGTWMCGQLRIFRSGKMNSEHLAALHEAGFIQEDRPSINARQKHTSQFGEVRDDVQVESRG